jgi:hypothetical protein
LVRLCVQRLVKLVGIREKTVTYGGICWIPPKMMGPCRYFVGLLGHLRAIAKRTTGRAAPNSQNLKFVKFVLSVMPT